MNLRFVMTALACGVTVAAIYTLNNDPSIAQEAPPAAPVAGAADADLFKVPEGNDPQVLATYLQKVMNEAPSDGPPEAFQAYLNKMQAMLGEVLQRELPAELRSQVTQARLEVLYLRPLARIENSQPDYDKYLAELLKTGSPEIQKLATEIDVQLRINYLPRYTPDEQQVLVSHVEGLLKRAPADNREQFVFAAQSMMDLSEKLEMMSSPLALDGYQKLVDNVKSRNDERLQGLTSIIEPRIYRLGLNGKPIELTSKTLDGKPFALQDLKGKVVLVDFWATWCGPCIAEFPKLRELYAAYKDKGFEIVGVSLDSDKATLEKFLDSQKLPWQIVFDDSGPMGFDTPLAQKFGIFGTPTVWLIDREGNMVEQYAHGTRLIAQLEKLLGPLPAEPPAIPASPEPPAAPK